jgi:hypothetical protein
VQEIKIKNEHFGIATFKLGEEKSFPNRFLVTPKKLEMMMRIKKQTA